MALNSVDKSGKSRNRIDQLARAVYLHERTKAWPTASARDWKGTYVTLVRKDGKMRGDLLPDAVKIEEERAGQPAPASLNTTGKRQEQQAEMVVPEARGKLNPDWVEQLMGLPVGWTDFGSWGTE
jgi:hypothetical protein